MYSLHHRERIMGSAVGTSVSLYISLLFLLYVGKQLSM